MGRPLGVPEVRWERMFPDDLDQALERCPVLYLPYGLCEPHGPHSALGCDGLRAHAICRRAATAHGGVVAPPHYWHIHEIGGFGIWASRKVGEVARPWLTAVPPWLFFKTLCYHVRAADQLGFRAAVLYSGHGGPHAQDAARFLELIQPRVGARLALVVEGDDLKDPSSPFAYGEWADHAGKGETSQLWAVEPDAVDLSRLPAPDEPGPHFAMDPSAAESSRRSGDALLRHKTAYLGRVAAGLLAEHERLAPKARLLTYAEVESLWSEVVAPQFPTFSCMQDGDGTVPPDSRWHANWRVPKAL